MKPFVTILAIFLFSFGLSNTPVVLDSGDEISQNQPKVERVILSPNPTNAISAIKIVDNVSKVNHIAIYSILGNQLFKKDYSATNNTIQLNVQNFKKGKYLVKIVFEDGSTEVKALIKQ